MPDGIVQLAVRIALLDENEAFLVLGRAHMAAADPPSRLVRMRLFLTGAAVPQAGQRFVPASAARDVLDVIES